MVDGGLFVSLGSRLFTSRTTPNGSGPPSGLKYFDPQQHVFPTWVLTSNVASRWSFVALRDGYGYPKEQTGVDERSIFLVMERDVYARSTNRDGFLIWCTRSKETEHETGICRDWRLKRVRVGSKFFCFVWLRLMKLCHNNAIKMGHCLGNPEETYRPKGGHSLGLTLTPQV